MRVLETGTFRERIGSGLTGLALFAAALLLTGCTMDRPGGPATDARPAGSRAAEVD